MFKFTTSVVLIAALVGVAFAAVEQPAGIESTLEVVPDIAAFKAAHPDLDVIPLEVSRNARQQIVYTLGNRVSGDRLQATSQDGQSWSSLQDVALNLRYPQSGVGAVVSYVQVVVNQSSNQGRGYVVAGGVGQRFVQLVVEAYNTNYFNYNAQVYGY